MAVVTKVFDVLTRKLQKLQFNPDEKQLDADDNSSFSSCEYFIDDREPKNMQKVDVPPAQTMEMDLLEKKIKRLLAKLKKHNVYLHVFDHADIHYGPTLGKGGEGIVQKCTIMYNDLPVDAAVKTVLNNTDDALDLTFGEIELLCLAKDPIMTTTLQVYGVAAVPDREDPTKGHLVIVTEAGIKNVLQLYRDEVIPLHVTYNLWHSVSVAMHCLHKKNIIHQDLKPENILVTGVFRDNYGMLENVNIKIIDLGMARTVEGGKVVSDDILGTQGYHSPEVLFDESYDLRADIFVLGVTFCVMLLPQAAPRSSMQAFLKRVHEAKERGLVGRSLFFSVLQPAMDKDINISDTIVEMLCKMLERVERRCISLLEVAAICQQESNLVRHLPSHINHNTRSRPSNLDSGIDSFGCDTNNHKGIDENDQKKTMVKIAAESTSAKNKATPGRARRKPARVNPYARNTKVGNIKKDVKEKTTIPTPSTPVCVSPEGPICRRTRSSVKRLAKKSPSCCAEGDDHERPRKRKNLVHS